MALRKKNTVTKIEAQFYATCAPDRVHLFGIIRNEPHFVPLPPPQNDGPIDALPDHERGRRSTDWEE